MRFEALDTTLDGDGGSKLEDAAAHSLFKAFVEPQLAYVASQKLEVLHPLYYFRPLTPGPLLTHIGMGWGTPLLSGVRE